MFCLEQSVNTGVDLTQCLSADETSRDTVLALPPETGRQVEESILWLLCGNPDYLLMEECISTVCNPWITTFNLSPPPVQLIYAHRKGKKRGIKKNKLKKGQWPGHSACPLVSWSRKSDECPPFTWVISTQTNTSMYTQCYADKFNLVDWGRNLCWLKNVGRLEPQSNNGLNQARREGLHHSLYINIVNITTHSDTGKTISSVTEIMRQQCKNILACLLTLRARAGQRGIIMKKWQT